jgi:hypothetical protein
MAQFRSRFYYRLANPDGAHIMDGESPIAFVPLGGVPSILEKRAALLVDALNESEEIERFKSGDGNRCCPTCGNLVDADGDPLRTD